MNILKECKKDIKLYCKFCAMFGVHLLPKTETNVFYFITQLTHPKGETNYAITTIKSKLSDIKNLQCGLNRHKL